MAPDYPHTTALKLSVYGGKRPIPQSWARPWNRLAALFLAVSGLSLTTQVVLADAFISEIFLPEADGGFGPAVEISGVGSAGATLLIVDARPERRLIVRRSFTLKAPGSTLLGEAGTLSNFFPTQGPGPIPGTLKVPAFGLPLIDPVALVVIEGTSALGVGTPLDPPTTVSAELAHRPIVDWVTLGPGNSREQAEAGTFAVGYELAVALAIDELSRPIAPIQRGTAWARPVVDGWPQLDQLLPGSIAFGISGIPADLRDFPISPGAGNPEASSALLPPVLPEPNTGLLMLGLTLAMSVRSEHGDCPANASCL